MKKADFGKRGFWENGLLGKGDLGWGEWEFEKNKIWEKLEFGELEF